MILKFCLLDFEIRLEFEWIGLDLRWDLIRAAGFGLDSKAVKFLDLGFEFSWKVDMAYGSSLHTCTLVCMINMDDVLTTVLDIISIKSEEFYEKPPRLKGSE